MKSVLTLAFAVILSTTFTHAEEVSVADVSRANAKSAVISLLKIHFGGAETYVAAIVNESASADDNMGIEKIEILGQAYDADGLLISTDLYYDIEITNGLITAIKVRCPACG